jgi:hypothetical protein
MQGVSDKGHAEGWRRWFLCGAGALGISATASFMISREVAGPELNLPASMLNAPLCRGAEADTKIDGVHPLRRDDPKPVTLGRSILTLLGLEANR